MISQFFYRCFMGAALILSALITVQVSAVDFEAENLTRTSSATGTAVATNQSGSSNNAFVYLNGTPAVNDWMEFTIPNLAAGTYNIKIYYKSNNNRGIFQTRIGGTTIGSTCNQYAASPVNQVLFDAGNRTFVAGNHQLRMTVTGKSVSSSGYVLTLDKLSLTPIATPPTITTQPANQSVIEGSGASFIIAATGTGTLTYQWRKNGANIPGATATTYTTPPTTMADNGTLFSCVVTNAGGNSTSNNATLTVGPNLRRQDSLALVAFYNSTGGPNWTNNTNWLTEQPIDMWHGVTVSGNRVTNIFFATNNLSGTLPRDIGTLTALTSMYLIDDQSLSGAIPAEIGDCANLETLILLANNLSGSIPSEMGNLQQLKYLRVTNNFLTGTIPASIANAANLESLDLANNQLTGTIPPELGNLTRLQALNLQGNQLTGTIPPTLGRLTLGSLVLDNNQLTGQIPVELANWAGLRELFLNNNNLTGTIPAQIGNCSQLFALYLNNNSFTNLPMEITNLTAITQGDLGRNQFCNLSPLVASWATAIDPDWSTTQTCPPPLVQISATPLSGNTPLNATFTATNTGSSAIYTWSWDFGDGTSSTIQNASHTYVNAGIFTARLTAAGIGGTAEASVTITAGSPPTIVRQPEEQTVFNRQTATFDIGATGNGLTYQWRKNGIDIAGAASPSYTTPPAAMLDDGSIFSCVVSNASGSVTSADAALTVLMVPREQDSLALVAFYNATGGPEWTNNTNWLSSNPIDTWFGVEVAGNRVRRLDFNTTNNIIGTLPTEIGNLTGMRVLYIMYNAGLTGQIPASIGNLTNLSELQLIWCNISGPLPRELGSLRQLVHLDLGHNSIGGTLPEWLGDLTGLESLSLHTNQFTGSIPASIGQLTKLRGLLLTSNQLTGQLPAEIGNLTQLVNFDCALNNLTGAVPVSFGNLKLLTVLNLFDNEFTDLPATIVQLSAIQNCNLFQNNFCNLIPEVAAWANTKDPLWYARQGCPAPEISVEASALSGQSPLPVTFTATNARVSAIYSWNWDFGDGTTSNVQNPQHTFGDGTFQVTLIASGIGGADTVSITIEATGPPYILAQPENLTVLPGQTGTFTVQASGRNISYQWKENGKIIYGANATSYTTPPVMTYDNGNRYSCVVRNSRGSVTSNDAVLTVQNSIDPPFITQHPSNTAVTEGQTAVLTVTATGTPPLVYEWKKGETTVGGNSPTLTIADASAEDAGFYSVIVSNLNDSYGSFKALLTVLPVGDPVFNSRKLSVSGELRDADGSPVGDETPVTVDVTIRLMNRETAGASVITERFHQANNQGILVDKGLFTARLGEGTADGDLQQALSASPHLYAEIIIEGDTPDTLRPRTPLASSGQSMAASAALPRHGAGIPDASVDAPVGTFYINDTDGSTWVKANRGWRELQ